MRRFAWLILPLAFIGVTLTAAVLTPNPQGFGTHQKLGLPPCLFLLMTGWLCPSCGLTTSFTQLVHFHWIKAFSAHPLGPVFYLGFALLSLFSIFEFFGKKTPLGSFLRGQHVNWVYGGLVIYLMTWGGRLILHYH